MASIKRKVLLRYQDLTQTFIQMSSSDKQALVFSIRDLEKKLGKMPGSLRRHFTDKDNWDIILL